jgi:predicted transport protein
MSGSLGFVGRERPGRSVRRVSRDLRGYEAPCGSNRAPLRRCRTSSRGGEGVGPEAVPYDGFDTGISATRTSVLRPWFRLTEKSSSGTRGRRRVAVLDVPRDQAGPMADLAKAADEILIGLGDGVTRVQRKQYAAYQRLRNFACLIPPQQTKVLVYLKVDPTTVDLLPGITRNVTGVGHHGTGDLEVQLRTERDLERAQDLFRLSYSAA